MSKSINILNTLILQIHLVLNLKPPLSCGGVMVPDVAVISAVPQSEMFLYVCMYVCMHSWMHVCMFACFILDIFRE